MTIENMYINWKQLTEGSVKEIGEFYGIEQKEYETIDDYRDRLIRIISKKDYHESKQRKPQFTLKEIPKKIIGIDPGIANLGWAIIEYKNNNYKYIKSGIIENPKTIIDRLNKMNIETTNGERYNKICSTILEKILEHAPIQQIAIEEVFYNKNAKSMKTTAGTIAIVEMVAAYTRLETIMVTPIEVKKRLTETTKADKELIIKCINNILNTNIKNTHEADAIAVAITGAQKSREKKQENKPIPRRKKR